jgi:hypothetical protein
MGKYTDPFGQADCEAELKELAEEGYRKLYFGQTPFNAAALEDKTYLIVGRRGAGKTALCHYFSFQRQIHDPIVIDVDEPTEYRKVLNKIARRADYSPELAIPHARDVWTYLIWCLLFENTKSQSEAIANACVPCRSSTRRTHSGVLHAAIDWLLDQFSSDELAPSETELSMLKDEAEFVAAREAVMSVSKVRPIFVAVDTLEKYDVGDVGLMNAISGLIEAAAGFNNEFATRGLHIKVFVSGEIFPHLMEVALQNPLKSVKRAVHMLWRAKDLLRLIAWRYHRFLKRNGLLLPISTSTIDWDDPREVLHKAWEPYFGKTIIAGNGEGEYTFPHILRHTQMRPRQLIVLCNEIANEAIEAGTFPRMGADAIARGVERGEQALATEILNSYSLVHSGVAKIVRALQHMPSTFAGSELDKRAPESARHWTAGGYSADAFSRLVVELGIVGRVVHQSEAGHVAAEFEYGQQTPLYVSHRDRCVIHPMFARMLHVVSANPSLNVMPFLVSDGDRAWLNASS